MKSFRISLFDTKSYSPFQISIRFYLLFIILFFIARALFLFQHYDLVHHESNQQLFTCFSKAILLDISTCSFLFIIPFCLLLLGFAKPQNYMYRVYRCSIFLIGIFVIVLLSVDIVLYEDWQTKLNYKALSYLDHPSEIVKSATNNYLVSFIILAFVQFCFFYYFYKKWFLKNATVNNKSLLYRFFFIVIVFGLSTLAYRGGIQPIPINVSDTYFSKNQVLNDAASNTIWYLANSINENKILLKEKPFQFYKKEDAIKTVTKMYDYPKDSTIHFLTIVKPNIVVVILESFCADVMGGFGGHDSCTPQLDILTKNGISFQQCYAPGWRSDMGIPSIISSVSCDPYKSIASQNSKFKGLSSFTKTINNNGYYTSFLFGGQLSYGNIKSYIYWNEFDKIKEQTDIKNNYKKGRLGIHDEGIFAESINDMNKYQQPFCSYVYTLSSHPPYDMPMKAVFNNGGAENQYINSIYYTDKCIGTFMENCKKEKWYDSTLFVFIADHGHGTPSYKQWDFASHRIPLLFYGNVIDSNYRGYKCNTIISQTDLNATLLAQLNLPYDSFIFSKDAMNPYCPSFAPYIINNGYGMITDKGIYSYNYFYNKIEYESIKNPADRNNLILQCKSYIQRTFDFFDGL